ncbi:MAG TPA: MarR family transcriptional regulator [Actinomycetes bacterium]|nr:MarR family transcriptional regulator [Actinomycetes bacterium]
MTSVNGRAAPAGEDPLGFALHLDLAVRAWRRAIDERVGPRVLGELAPGATLRRSHLRLLSLTPPDGLRVTDLATRAAMTKQALGEFVAALQEAGLVEVAVDERDRRVRLVRPTEAGRRLQGVIEAAFAEIEQGWRDRVGPERWAAFREALASIGDDAG